MSEKSQALHVIWNEIKKCLPSRVTCRSCKDEKLGDDPYLEVELEFFVLHLWIDDDKFRISQTILDRDYKDCLSCEVVLSEPKALERIKRGLKNVFLHHMKMYVKEKEKEYREDKKRMENEIQETYDMISEMREAWRVSQMTRHVKQSKEKLRRDMKCKKSMISQYRSIIREVRNSKRKKK